MMRKNRIICGIPRECDGWPDRPVWPCRWHASRRRGECGRRFWSCSRRRRRRDGPTGSPADGPHCCAPNRRAAPSFRRSLVSAPTDVARCSWSARCPRPRPLCAPLLPRSVNTLWLSIHWLYSLFDFIH